MPSRLRASCVSWAWRAGTPPVRKGPILLTTTSMLERVTGGGRDSRSKPAIIIGRLRCEIKSSVQRGFRTQRSAHDSPARPERSQSSRLRLGYRAPQWLSRNLCHRLRLAAAGNCPEHRILPHPRRTVRDEWPKGARRPAMCFRASSRPPWFPASPLVPSTPIRSFARHPQAPMDWRYARASCC